MLISVKKLRSLIQEKVKRQYDKLSFFDQLDQYTDLQNFIHFSDLPKLGINPKSDFETPIGIYGYPLDHATLQKIKSGTIEFAGDRKYIHVFRVKPEYKQDIIEMGNSTYTEQELEKDIAQLKIIGFKENLFEDEAHFNDFIHYAKLDSREKSSIGQLWNITRKMAQDNIVKWTTILLKLGYKGFTDVKSCLGLIHSNEPCQAVFFSSKFIEHLDTIENKQDYEKWNFPKLVNSLRNRKIPIDSFKKMYQRLSLSRASVIFNDENISDEYKSLFVDHPNINVRRILALDTNNEDIIQKLLDDKETIVIDGAINNQYTTNDQLMYIVDNNKDQKIVDVAMYELEQRMR